MKATTTLAFLLGVVLTAPSFAEDMGRDSNAQNPQQEDFKSYVIDALDAHKKKAPKELQGHHEEIKAYVGRALDAQKLGHDKLKDAKSLQEAVQNLIDASSVSRGIKGAVGSCFVEGKFDEVRFGALLNRQKGNLSTTLLRQCTGDTFWTGWSGSCENKYVKKACEVTAIAAHVDRSFVQHCLDTPVKD